MIVASIPDGTTAAQLQNPYGLALDIGGNLHIADFNNSRVRRVAPESRALDIRAGLRDSPVS